MGTMTLLGAGSRLRIIIIVVLVSLLAWLLWPVQVILEGNGIIQPVFEQLVQIIPPESGVVCRVTSSQLSNVRAGDILLEYIPASKASFLSYASMTSPGGINQPEALPEWYIELDQRRKTRIEAANHWQGLMFNQHPKPWERELARRFVLLAVNEGDLERNRAQQQENVRLGREAANKVYVHDDSLGQIVPVEQGIPLSSPADGILYSFWARPVMHITGPMHSALPVMPPGSPAMRAIASGTAGTPVAEILPPGVPSEVLALVPVDPSLRWLTNGRESVFTAIVTDSMGIRGIEFGSVPISPDDARLLVPGFASAQDAVFVRLRLAEGDLADWDRKVSVRLISPRYPRAWYWLKGRLKDGISH